RLGIEKTAMIRVRAGLSYALAEAMDDGHCGLPHEQLAALTTKLIEVGPDLIHTALALELKAEQIRADTVEGRRCIFLGHLHRAEQEIAEQLRALLVRPLPWPAIDAGKSIPWVERKTGLVLAESQRQAVRLALCSKVLVIT